MRAPLALACALAVLGLALGGEPRHHHQHRAAHMQFSHEPGLFVQESKSAELSEPGQHDAFGARLPWPDIFSKLQPGRRKLLLLVRHGEAASNAVQRAVGDAIWEGEVAKQCSWTNASTGETLELFDPALTAAGQQQARALRQALQHGSVGFQALTGGRAAAMVVSPLRRTLETFQAALGPLAEPARVAVDEYCRERLGKNTCDARHPATLPLDSAAGTCNGSPEAGGPHKGIACPATWALADAFPDIHFPVTGQSRQLGLVGNTDPWWRADERESDAAMARRAALFLSRVFDRVSEDVVFVVTHSGMIGALLAAVGREPYSATNAELVPALVIAEPVA